jgi:Flp pilus assembly protein TadB
MAALWVLVAMACGSAAAALVLPPRGPTHCSSVAPSFAATEAAAATGDAARVVPWSRVAATAAVGSGVAVLVGGPWGIAAGALAAVGCHWFSGRVEPRSARRRRERLLAAVPHVVDLMAACLSAGLSPAAAVDQIVDALQQPVQQPIREELRGLSARLRLGVDPVTVWRDLARHPQLGGLGRSMARAVESGASVADAMHRLADDIRQRSRADVEARARSVGVKAAVPLGVCLLPAFVLVGVVPLVAGAVSVLVGG